MNRYLRFTRLFFLFAFLLAFSHCKSMIAVDSAKLKKESSTSTFAITSGNLNAGKVGVEWSVYGEAEYYEIIISEKLSGRACVDEILRIRTSDAKTSVENTSKKKKLYACLRAKKQNSEEFVDAVNSGYPLGEDSKEALKITSSATSIPIGTSIQLTASHTDTGSVTSDVTSKVTWKASNTKVSISATGIATGAELGVSTITATLSEVSATFDLTVGEVTTIGLVDSTFGSSGSGSSDIAGASTNDIVRGLLQTTDGGFLLLGNTTVGGKSQFAMAKYTSSGVLDTGFNGGTGKLILNFTGADYGGAFDAAYQSNGKIVISGFSYDSVGSLGYHGFSRISSNGTLDTTFGTLGYSQIALLGSYLGQSNGISVLPNDTFFSFGLGNYSNHTGYGVVRGNADGTLNTSTYTASGAYSNLWGWQTANPGLNWFGHLGQTHWPIGILKTYSDGGILVAGTNVDSTPKLQAVKYAPNGGLDASFGTGGWAEYALPASWQDVQFNPTSYATSSYDMKILANGKFIFVGRYVNAGTHYTGIGRLNADFTLDTTFAGTGLYTYSFGDAYNYPVSLLIQADGRIIAVSEIKAGNHQIGVARFSADGQVDTTYGTNGLQIIALPAGVTSVQPRKAMLLSDGSLVVVGAATVGGQLDFFITKIK